METAELSPPPMPVTRDNEWAVRSTKGRCEMMASNHDPTVPDSCPMRYDCANIDYARDGSACWPWQRPWNMDAQHI